MTIIPGDATATGVAMLAGLGAGAFRDVEDAIARCVHPGPPILPVAAAHDFYEDRYAAYEALAASAVVRAQRSPHRPGSRRRGR